VSLAYTNAALVAIAARLVLPDIKTLAWWSISAGVRLGTSAVHQHQRRQTRRCPFTPHTHLKGAA
jgi:hypothetical protein